MDRQTRLRDVAVVVGVASVTVVGVCVAFNIFVVIGVGVAVVRVPNVVRVAAAAVVVFASGTSKGTYMAKR